MSAALRTRSLLQPVLLLALASFCGAIDLTSFRPGSASATGSSVFLFSNGEFGASVDSGASAQSASWHVDPTWHWFTVKSSDTGEQAITEWLYVSWLGSQVSRSSEYAASKELHISELIAPNWQHYIAGSDFQLSAAPSLQLSGARSWATSWGGDEWNGAGNLGLNLSAGYGHMRDAQPLMRTIRIISILRDNQALAHEPGDSALREIAGFVSRSWTLSYDHDRVAKFFYDSLETYLTRTGAISEPLPAFVLMQLDDALLVGTDQREFGSQVLVGARASANGSVDWTSEGSGWRKQGAWGLSPSVEYDFARPIGLRWTTIAGASYSLSIPAAALVHSLRANLGGTYDIADRLEVQAGIDLGADAGGEASKGTPWDAKGSVTAGLNYYLTDRLQLAVASGVSSQYSNPGSGAGQGSAAFNLKFSLSAGPQWSPVSDLNAGRQ
jgi:hypothetical protein